MPLVHDAFLPNHAACTAALSAQAPPHPASSTASHHKLLGAIAKVAQARQPLMPPSCKWLTGLHWAMLVCETGRPQRRDAIAVTSKLQSREAHALVDASATSRRRRLHAHGVHMISQCTRVLLVQVRP